MSLLALLSLHADCYCTKSEPVFECFICWTHMLKSGWLTNYVIRKHFRWIKGSLLVFSTTKKICILPVPVLYQDNGHHLQLQLKEDPILPAMLLLPNLHPHVEVHPHMEVHPLPKLGPKELGTLPGWTTRPPLLASLKDWRSLTCQLHLRREEVSTTACVKERLADSNNITPDFHVSSLENRSRNWTFSLTGKTSKCSCPPIMTKYHQIHFLSRYEVKCLYIHHHWTTGEYYHVLAMKKWAPPKFQLIQLMELRGCTHQP